MPVYQCTKCGSKIKKRLNEKLEECPKCKKHDWSEVPEKIPVRKEKMPTSLWIFDFIDSIQGYEGPVHW